MDFDMDKVRSTLKQLVRDWSEEVRHLICPLKFHSYDKIQGKDEREASYQPIKEALLEHFSDIPMHERYGRAPAPTNPCPLNQIQAQLPCPRSRRGTR
jgi:hypothetical protein